MTVPPAGERRPATVAFAFLDLQDGGAQRLTLVACRLLRPELFRPVLLCARGGGSLVAHARSEGLAVHEAGRLRQPWDLSGLVVLARRISALAPEIVHVPLYSRASPYLRLAARLARVPLVVAHEWGRPGPAPPARRLVDLLLRPGTRFVAASRAQRAELLAAGVPAARISVVPSGIDVARFAGGDRSATRRRLGIEPAAPVALVAARLHPMKGHEDLVAALPEVFFRVPELVVLLAGDGPLRGRLERRLAERPWADRVRLLGHREEMPDLLAAADFAVLPSRREGIPSALLEAYAAGRPVVATAVGGVPEALTEGVEGRLVPPGDRAALAAAIAALAADDARRREMGDRGRQRVAREFAAGPATRRLEEQYLAWLGLPGAPEEERREEA